MSLNRVKRRRSSGCLYLVLVGVLAAGALVCLLAYNLSGEDETTPEEGDNRLIYGLTLNPSGFDPHFNQSSEIGLPFYSVYDTLIYRHPQTGEFVPGLASSWTVSEDRLRYTFNLRQDVVFHDGTSFNADAVGVNFDRFTNPAFGSQKALPLLGPYYEGYALPGPFTFEIVLTQPYEPLLDGLSQMYLGIASPLALANHTDGRYQWNQVGTGPYRMIEAVPGERIVLERNPDYAWGPSFYAQENPNPVETVEFRFYTDAPTRDDALRAGEVDFIGELLPSDSEELLSDPDIRLYPVAIPGQPLQFIFNLNRFPTDTVQVRQALLYATNRTAIVDTVFGGQSPVAHGPLSAVTPFYNPRLQELYPYDPDQAAQLMSQANITDSDDDGFYDVNGEPLTLTLLAPPWGLIPETAIALEGQWREQGIQVEVVRVPSIGELFAAIEAGEYNLVAFYEFGVDPVFLNSYFSTEGRNNFAGYSNPQVDEWLTQAVVERDPTTRASLYEGVQEQIMQDAVILPIRDYVNLNGGRADLQGVIFSSTGWWPLLTNFQWGG